MDNIVDYKIQQVVNGASVKGSGDGIVIQV
jgi:hypothetical protein